MNDAMAQFKDTYITECLELLGTMEENLIGLDASASNETLNAIFRCAIMAPASRRNICRASPNGSIA